MKQKIFVIIAVICICCLLIATLVSAKRARLFPSLGRDPEQVEDTTTSENEQETEEQEPESGTTESNTTELETEQDGELPVGLDYVEYTGQAHQGTCIAYRGNGVNAGYVIVIDAGHQLHAMSELEPNGPGSDQNKAKVTGGTQGSFTGLAEYELNLRVALALRDELVAKGYTVVMVRETNEVEISNAERAQMANKVHADVNIRIHANGDTDASKKGAMAVCQTPANPYNANIYQTCRELSDAVLQAFCASTGIEQRNVWETDTMTGTNWATVPTTIVEMGFMTNQEDDVAMAAEGFAQSAALGLAQGIENYLAQREQSTQGTEPEQDTRPGAPYDIDYALEAELGQTFTDVYMTVEVTGGMVWVRTEPSTRGGALTQVNDIRTFPGKPFTCIGWGEDWHRLLIDGKVYYMSAKYLKAVTE